MNGYEIEVDQATSSQWSECLRDFADANLYQTWAYGEVRWGRRRTSHLILRRDGTVVAMAQVAVFQPLGLKMGIAQIRWGPLLERRGALADLGTARIMADVLHNEYASRRGLRLRVLPAGWQVPGALSLSQAAFAHYKIEQFDPGESYRTMIVDLRPDLDTIRKQLDQKWRNQLNRAERNGLSIREHSGEDELLTFARLYDEMTARKQFAATDVGEFQRMQGLLPAEQRMRVLTCEDGGVPVAGVVGSAVGRTGIYLLGATNERGMKCKAAYLLQWRLIEWLKQSGAEFYDLGGVNPDTNPGVYHFKRGFGGADVRYVSPYIAYGTKASELAARALRLARQYRPRPGQRATQSSPSP